MTLPTHLLESIASAAVREGLADAVYTRMRTPIGTLLVVQGEEGVVRVGFPEEREDVLLAQVAGQLGPRIVASDSELATTRDVFSAYFEGDDESLDVPVDLSLVRSDFRRAALQTLRERDPRRRRRDVRRAREAHRPPEGRPRRRQRLRDQPRPDHRPVPPRRARLRRRRQLRRRPRAQAPAARARGRDGQVTPASIRRRQIAS